VKLHVSKAGFRTCEGCGTGATLRTLDVAVPARPARKGKFGQPAIPASFCPLIALCGMCWTDVREMLRKAATPDSSGEVSPP
jgi:hypothetical protein